MAILTRLPFLFCNFVDIFQKKTISSIPIFERFRDG